MVLISHPGGKKCSSEFVNSLVSSNTIPSSSAAMLLPSPRRDWSGNTTRRGRSKGRGWGGVAFVRSCAFLGKGKPRNRLRSASEQVLATRKMGERKKMKRGEGAEEGGKEKGNACRPAGSMFPFSFPLPFASFFALFPFFARPKLVRSPIAG